MLRQANSSVVRFGDLPTLQRWILDGKVDKDDEISRTGVTWRPLASIAELSAFFRVRDEVQGPETAAGEAAAAASFSPQPSEVYASPARSGMFSQPPPPPAPAGAAAAMATGVSPIPSGEYMRPPSPVTAVSPRPDMSGAYGVSPQPSTPPGGPDPAWTATGPGASASWSAPPRPASTRSGPLLTPRRVSDAFGEFGEFSDEFELTGHAQRRTILGVIVGMVLLGVAVGVLLLWIGGHLDRPGEAESATMATRGEAAPPRPTSGKLAVPEPGPKPPEAVPAPEPKPEPVAKPTPKPKAAPRVTPPRKVVKKVVQRPPPPPPRRGYDGLLMSARKALMEGRAAQALEEYERASELNTRSPEPRAGIGWAYINMKKPHIAVLKFQEALRKNPRYGDAYIGLGKAYRMLGRINDAIQAYERYLQLHPNGPSASIARNALRLLKR